jgi:hypothetical protein
MEAKRELTAGKIESDYLQGNTSGSMNGTVHVAERTNAELLLVANRTRSLQVECLSHDSRRRQAAPNSHLARRCPHPRLIRAACILADGPVIFVSAIQRAVQFDGAYVIDGRLFIRIEISVRL